MIMFFVLMEKLYVLCVSGDCIITSASNLNAMVFAGGIELFLELTGIVKIYKKK